MTCYCANYYGSINCQNSVPNFGDRCALCLSMQVNNTGALAMQNGVLQVSEHWVENSKREQLRREEESASKDRVRRISTGGSR